MSYLPVLTELEKLSSILSHVVTAPAACFALVWFRRTRRAKFNAKVTLRADHAPAGGSSI
jgi:hypothetical protein